MIQYVHIHFIGGKKIMSCLNILDTANHYGNMNTAKSFYPKCMTKEYRQEDFLKRRIILGNEKGFDGHKMFMANQKHKTGTYHIMNDEKVLNAEDGWKVDIDEDILITTKDAPGIVAGHPVADCPVVIVGDRENGVTAVCHCSGELVDKKLPLLTFEALHKAEKDLGLTFSDQNVWAYVSACAGPNWTYNCYPNWATDEKVWENSIAERKNGIFNINIHQAILDQFSECGLTDVRFKLTDTITDPNYYSHSASFTNPVKAGRQYIGAFYSSDAFVKVK